METVPRLFRAPAGSFFLFGPRGTGKSTWLRREFPRALTIDFLDPETVRAYSARPERLREAVEGAPGARQVVIDEIQRVPELLNVVHQLIEEKHRGPLQFILTGSSARKLKRTGVNLLGGRLLLKTMHPFMAAELGARFDLERSLEFGMLPLVLGSGAPAETLRSYAALYVREEVQAEGLVRNMGDFSRFLESVSFSQGSVLSMAEVARECEVERRTADGYLDILEDLLLGFRVQVFNKRAKRILVRHPKFYYADVGVFRSIRPRGPLDASSEIGGACLEGLVAQHLRAWIAYGRGAHSLGYWRTKSGTEVDFIVYGDHAFVAIEVKHARSVSVKDLRPLRAFLEDYPAAKACLVYRGKARVRIGGIACVPCGDFLAGLKPGSPILPA